jgi:hypothetical protein
MEKQLLFIYFSRRNKLNHFRGNEPTGLHSVLSCMNFRLEMVVLSILDTFSLQLSLRSSDLLIYHSTTDNMHTVKTLIFRLNHAQGISDFSVIVAKYSDESSFSQSSVSEIKFLPKKNCNFSAPCI